MSYNSGMAHLVVYGLRVTQNANLAVIDLCIFLSQNPKQNNFKKQNTPKKIVPKLCRKNKPSAETSQVKLHISNGSCE